MSVRFLMPLIFGFFYILQAFGDYTPLQAQFRVSIRFHQSVASGSLFIQKLIQYHIVLSCCWRLSSSTPKNIQNCDLLLPPEWLIPVLRLKLRMFRYLRYCRFLMPFFPVWLGFGFQGEGRQGGDQGEGGFAWFRVELDEGGVGVVPVWDVFGKIGKIGSWDCREGNGMDVVMLRKLQIRGRVGYPCEQELLEPAWLAKLFFDGFLFFLNPLKIASSFFTKF